MASPAKSDYYNIMTIIYLKWQHHYFYIQLSHDITIFVNIKKLGQFHLNGLRDALCRGERQPAERRKYIQYSRWRSEQLKILNVDLVSGMRQKKRERESSQEKSINFSYILLFVNASLAKIMALLYQMHRNYLHDIWQVSPNKFNYCNNFGLYFNNNMQWGSNCHPQTGKSYKPSNLD